MALSQGGAQTAHSPPSSIRSRAAVLIVVTALAMIAGLVSLAVVADGREVSQASSNDGGAWLVNRELGVVGHRNRAAGELSSFMRISESPETEIHQADGVIVVHDPATQLLHEVDARTFGEDLEPTLLPAGAQVYAVDGSVVVAHPDPLRVWRLTPARLATLVSLDDVEPELDLASSGTVAASPDGRVVAFDAANDTLHWLNPDGLTSSVVVPTSGDVVDLTIVEGSAVLLTTTGQLVAVGPDSIEHDLAWSSLARNGQPVPTVLQQPSSTHSSGPLRAATTVIGVSGDGAIVDIALDDPATATIRASLAGSQPLRPVVFDGCVYAVVTQPALLGVACEQLTTRRLEGAGTALQLRLVNGWVWVNDLADGGTWLATDDADVELLNDWGLAERALEDDADDDGGSSTTAAADRTLFADADAEGSVQDSDDFDPAEVNVAPIAVDDTASTRLDRVSVVPVLANDIDLNNDILVIDQVVLLSGQAQISVTPARDQIQISPDPGFSGLVEVEYWISDGRSAPVSAFLTVEVAPIDVPNTPPVTETDVVATAPGHATTIDVLRNDRDPDGDAIALVGIESETGTLRWSPNGQVTFTPDSTTAAGWVELPYVIVDDLGAESTGVVRVEIRDRGANQEPDARNDQATTVVGRPVVLNLLENDSDPDGDALIIGSRPVLLEPEGAQVRMSSTDDGEFVFTADLPGTYLLSYTVTDSAIGGSEVDTARIRIDVLPIVVNAAPVAVRDDVVLAAGETQVVYVLDNDGDADGDVISIVDWQSAPGLRITEFSDSTGHIGFRIAAAPDAPQRSRFLYSISDGRSEPVSAPVVVTVVNRLPSDQPPIANDDVVEVRPGTTIEGLELLVNDFDPEGGALRIVNVAAPGATSQGATTSIDLEGRTISLSVPPDAQSSFTFAYDIEDQAGNRAGAVVRVQLIASGATNRPPTARADSVRTIQGVPVDIDALANDSDPDGDPIVLQSIIEQPEFGSAAVAPNGQIRYRPDDSFTGTDMIRYAIVDSSGDQAIGEIFAGVVPRDERNEPPIANDDAYSLAGSSILTPLDVLANDFDPEGDPLRVVDLTSVSHGIVAIDDFGRVQFGPPPRLAEPTTITFGYTIADNAGNRADAVVVIEMPAFDQPLPTPEPTVPAEPTPTPEPTPPSEPTPTAEPEPTPEPTPPDNVENQLPVAVSDTVGPTVAGASIVVDVLANDFDPDGDRDDLRVISVGEGGERNGAFVEVIAREETFQIPYTIVDADGGEATTTITVLVNANRPPQVQARTVEVPFETPVTLDLSGDASDPDDDPLFFVCCDAIRGGSINEVLAVEGTLALTFTPNQGFTGQAGFAYIVDDQQGHQVAGSVTVVVGAPDNRPPEALDNTVDLPQGATVAVELGELASDPDGDELTFTLESSPGSGIETQLDGSVLLLTAPPDSDEGATTTLAYRVSDGPLDASGTITIVITGGANEPPTATGTAIDLAAGSSATIDLAQLTADPDVDDQLSWEIVEVVGPVGVDVALNDAVLQVSAEPTLGGEQAQVDYRVTDRQGESATGLIIVNVTDPTAPPPTAVDDSANAQEGVPVTIDVLANDVDPLGGGLTVVTASADVGSVDVTDTGVRFTANDITGAVVIQYTIRDIAGREASANILVDTIGPPEQPAPPDVVATSEEATIVWSTPQTRGAPITGYIITSAVAGTRTVGIENSLTWPNLINGTEYTFTVTAISTVGNSPESEPSLPATPDEFPEAPSAPSVEFGDTELMVTWAEPVNRGSDIVGYELEIGGSVSNVEATGAALEFLWSGLTNGQAYTFRVRAENAAGFGPWSSSSSPETPIGLPSAPVIGTAQRGNLSGSLVIDWAEPANDNGGDILNYRVVPSIGSPVELGNATTSYDWSNLANGVEVTFQVQAENRAGWGPLSAVSNAIAPCGAPDAPEIARVTRLDQSVDMEIITPADNGCAITGYTVTTDGGLVQSTSANDFVFPNLTNGTSYSFRATALNEMGSSPPSVESPAVIPAGPPLCGGSGLNASNTAPGQVLIGWAAAIDNGDQLTGYEITYEGVSVMAAADTTETISGLANATTYTFSVRAVNTVGMSPVCGSTTVTTWSQPTAVNFSKSFDATTNELRADVTGGDSPSNPITSWNASFEHGSVIDQTWSGTTAPPSEFVMAVVEDGAYRFSIQICNAVGCVEKSTCCEDITLVGPPDQMDAPALSFEWPGWDRFGVDVFATFTPPADNGAPITNYAWEKRWMGASGTWHDDNGVAGPETELYVAFYPGYSTYWNGTSRGETIRWEVRAAAINDEGQADWSDWATIDPPLRTPHVVLGTGFFVPDCDHDSTVISELECVEVSLEVHGLAASQAYTVDFTPSLDPTDCPSAVIVTDVNGSFGGSLSTCLVNVNHGPHSYVAEIDGVFSAPAELGF